jgi:hypothetical protein
MITQGVRRSGSGVVADQVNGRRMRMIPDHICNEQVHRTRHVSVLLFSFVFFLLAFIMASCVLMIDFEPGSIFSEQALAEGRIDHYFVVPKHPSFSEVSFCTVRYF